MAAYQRGRVKRRRNKKREGPMTYEYKLKNTVANVGRRCQCSSQDAREYATPILTAVNDAARTVRCIYCSAKLTLATVSFDHRQPISRGGSVGISNLVVCCFQCNKTKGSLTADEYQSLLDLMATWPIEASLNVGRRLRLGGSFFGRFKRRKP